MYVSDLSRLSCSHTTFPRSPRDGIVHEWQVRGRIRFELVRHWAGPWNFKPLCSYAVGCAAPTAVHNDPRESGVEVRQLCFCMTTARQMTANVLCNLIITSIVSDIASKAFNSEHCRFETQLVTTGTAGCCHCNVPIQRQQPCRRVLSIRYWLKCFVTDLHVTLKCPVRVHCARFSNGSGVSVYCFSC